MGRGCTGAAGGAGAGCVFLRGHRTALRMHISFRAVPGWLRQLGAESGRNRAHADSARRGGRATGDGRCPPVWGPAGRARGASGAELGGTCVCSACGSRGRAQAGHGGAAAWRVLCWALADGRLAPCRAAHARPAGPLARWHTGTQAHTGTHGHTRAQHGSTAGPQAFWHTGTHRALTGHGQAGPQAVCWRIGRIGSEARRPDRGHGRAPHTWAAPCSSTPLCGCPGGHRHAHRHARTRHAGARAVPQARVRPGCAAHTAHTGSCVIGRPRPQGGRHTARLGAAELAGGLPGGPPQPSAVFCCLACLCCRLCRRAADPE